MLMLPYKSQKCRLTSKYGYRVHPIHGWKHFHGGIDLVGIGGDEIVAVAPGKVVRSRIVTNKADATWEWGNYVAVQGDDGVTVYYCHLAKRLVSVGARVKAGDVIGIEGATGQVTGKHLHFECRRGSARIDAAEYIGIKNVLGTYERSAVSDASDERMVYEVGDKYILKQGDVYSNGAAVPSRLIGRKYTVSQVKSDRILLREINSWVKI